MYSPVAYILKKTGLKVGFSLLFVLNLILLTFLLASATAVVTGSVLVLFNAYCLYELFRVLSYDIQQVNELLSEESLLSALQLNQKIKGTLLDIVPGLMMRSSFERRLIDQHFDSHAEIGHSARQLYSSTEQLDGNIKIQSTSTTSVAAAITEIGYSANHISERIKGVYDAANSFDQLSSEGREIFEKLGFNATEVAAHVDATYQLLSSLENHIVTVTSITSVIGEIATQTNLLALNAAIEAARAGQHGRGFAVVADEVRALALRSHESASEISSNIDEMKQQMSMVRRSMDGVVVCADKSVSQAREADAVLEKITTHSKQMTALLYDISSATGQQTTAVEEISERMEEVARITEQNNVVATQSAAIAGHILQLCGQAKEES
jgi:methyl-accepting chemotaxis protein